MNAGPVQEFLQSKIESGIFTGSSVIFGRPGKKLIEVHRGTIGNGFRELVEPTTMFDLQSITKAVATAPLFYQLLKENRVQLSDRVAGFLPADLIAKDSVLNSVTFKQLLTHSSGLSDADLAGHFENAEQQWSQMYNCKSYFSPGSAIEYTDLGYRILGKALENILKNSLESGIKDFIWNPHSLKNITFNPADKMETAATPDAHGIIDDEQVAQLGGVAGCDGAFGNAESLFQFLSSMLEDRSFLRTLNESIVSFQSTYNSHFDSLAIGPKTLGWEINSPEYNYSGPFHNPLCLEKAGGAGTFIWMDQKSRYIFIYLTNHGKPKPFDELSWNRLVEKVNPQHLSGIIYEQL